MIQRFILAAFLLFLSACASFNNPYAAYTQKEYEVSDANWRTAGAWRMKWVESDAVVAKDSSEEQKQKQKPLPLMERLSDHESESNEPNVNPDF